MMSSDTAQNVIAFAPYQAQRAFRDRKPLPYMLWYPQIGFVKPTATVTVFRREARTRTPERA